MERALVILVLLLFTSCGTQVDKKDLVFLNGYWEIEKVVMPNGQTKAYNINTTVDYFEIKGLTGFRKKVYPKFDGTYDTSNDAEPFTILQKGEAFIIQYKNALSQWIEKIAEIDEESLVVINEDGIMYEYKRFEPINTLK